MGLACLWIVLMWVQAQPADVAALLQQGDVAAGERRWHDAELAYQEAVDVDPNSAEAHVKLARAEEAISRASDDPDERTKDRDLAIQNLERAIEIAPNDATVPLQLAKLELFTAARGMTQALDDASASPLGRRIADDALRQKLTSDYDGMISDALAQLDRILAIQPKLARAMRLEAASYVLRCSLAPTEPESGQDAARATQWQLRAQASSENQSTYEHQNHAIAGLMSPQAILDELYSDQAITSAGPGEMRDVSPPAPAVTKSSVQGPVRIGGKVAAANLVKNVPPVYPPLAKAANVQGRVEFTVRIDSTGHVEKVQVLRGHPLLVNAAREAVLQWEYRPTLLNGQPVEVITNVSVNFGDVEPEAASAPQQ